MRIGLLTVYFADFGSYYHAAALQNHLIAMGHSCELINADLRFLHSPRLALAAVSTKVFPKFLQSKIAERLDMYRCYLALKKDVQALTVSSSAINLKKLTKQYDCVIVGSDELWSITNPNMRFVSAYFGYNISCPVISYSTSGISLSHPSEKQLQIMKKGLEKFSAIAVRDQITADWVGKLLDRSIPVVIDPTLLNPYFIGTRKKTEPYVIVYGEHFSDAQVSFIQSYAKKENLPIYGVVWKHSWCEKNIEVKSASDLQDYFRNAVYSFTSTFHGTIFSIVNQINFTSFISELRGKKVVALLNQLGLSDRLYKEKDKDIPVFPVNYQEVEKKLTEMRIASDNYLKSSLIRIQEGKE